MYVLHCRGVKVVKPPDMPEMPLSPNTSHIALKKIKNKTQSEMQWDVASSIRRDTYVVESRQLQNMLQVSQVAVFAEQIEATIENKSNRWFSVYKWWIVLALKAIDF